MHSSKPRTARSGLGIIWHFHQDRDGASAIWPEEVAGFRLIGYWPHADVPNDLDAKEIVGLWPERSVEAKVSRVPDVDDESTVRHVRASVQVQLWPDSETWRTALERSLKHLIDRGAAVAWCENETGVLMYDPEVDFAGCYAAYTAKTGFICLGGLDDPLKFLGDDPSIAKRIRSAVLAAD